MEGNKKKGNAKKVFFIIFLLIVLVAGIVIGYSSAYFAATVLTNPEPKNTTVTTGRMELEVTDGPKVGLEEATPGQYIEKTFSVKNVGTVEAYYNVSLSDLVNNFVDKDDLVYTLTSTDGGANAYETVVPSTSSKIVNNKLIAVNETHHYTLRITFKETNDNQNDNINKDFSAVIKVNE